jgi:hypothetical protein
MGDGPVEDKVTQGWEICIVIIMGLVFSDVQLIFLGREQDKWDT